MQILEIYNDRVLIKLIPQEKTSGGIIIPDSVTSLPKSKATVIKTGKGFTDEHTGEFFPNTVKEGDTVILSTFVCHSDNEFIIEGEKYYLVKERDLDCIIDERLSAEEFENLANSEELKLFEKRFAHSKMDFTADNCGFIVPNNEHITIDK